MPQEDLQKFLEAVRQDSSLQEKLQAEGADPVAVAQEAGFSITQAELIRAQASQIEDLSDEELEGAAGGGIATWKITTVVPTFTFTGCSKGCPDSY